MWPFDQFFGKAKAKRTKDVEVPAKSVASEVLDAFGADEEKPVEGRKGHTGQFVKAVAIRRFRNRIGAASRKHNRKRSKANKRRHRGTKGGKKFKM